MAKAREAEVARTRHQAEVARLRQRSHRRMVAACITIAVLAAVVVLLIVLGGQ